MNFTFNFREPDILEGYKLYSPDFGNSMTPSMKECESAVRAAVKEAKRVYRRKGDELFVRYARDLNRKSLAAVLAKFNEAASSGTPKDGLLSNPPDSVRDRRRLPLYKGLLQTTIDYNDFLTSLMMAMHTTTCLFEPQDLSFDIDDIIRKTVYHPGKGRFSSETMTKDVVLRENGLGTSLAQRVLSSFHVYADGSMHVSYLVFNRQDKLHVVFEIGKDSYHLEHYEIALHTARECSLYPGAVFEIKKSSSTSNFIAKYHDSDLEKLLNFGEQQMKSQPFFQFLQYNPVFLGGNGFIHFRSWIDANCDAILRTARKKGVHHSA